MSTGAPTPLDAAPASPPQVSLVTSATVIEHPATEREWLNGITWAPESCSLPDDPYYWECAGDGGSLPSEEKTIPAAETERTAQTFDIWHGVACSTFGFRHNAELFNARAARNLLRWQSYLLEQEFWLGTIATTAGFDNDFLAGTNPSSTVLNSGTDLNIVTALAELEQALSATLPGPGMIHAQPRVVTAWASHGLVTPSASGRQLRTAQGHTVVPGGGYPGTRAALLDPADADHSVVYATGPVTIHLGVVRNESGPALDSAAGLAADQIDRSVNDLLVRAERAAVIQEDGCAKFHALVDLTTEYGNT